EAGQKADNNGHAGIMVDEFPARLRHESLPLQARLFRSAWSARGKRPPVPLARLARRSLRLFATFLLISTSCNSCEMAQASSPCSLNPAIPEVEIALNVHGQERIVIRPSLIFRELDLFLGIGIGLALAHRLLHCGRKVLQVSELVARIVLGPGLLAARPGMPGNERFPIHRDDLF